jgi:hypothetical protein
MGEIEIGVAVNADLIAESPDDSKPCVETRIGNLDLALWPGEARSIARALLSAEKRATNILERKKRFKKNIEKAKKRPPRHATHYDTMTNGSHANNSCTDALHCDCECPHCIQYWIDQGRPGVAKGSATQSA